MNSKCRVYPDDLFPIGIPSRISTGALLDPSHKKKSFIPKNIAVM